MQVNLKPSQRVAVVGVIAPQSAGVGTVNSGWLDATTFHNYLAYLQLGTLGAAATVDSKIQQATSSGGAGAKDVVGKAIVQYVKATDDNKQAVINLKQEDLDIANGFKFFQLSATVGAAASLLAATVFGVDPRYGMASDAGNKAASQAQTIA